MSHEYYFRKFIFGQWVACNNYITNDLCADVKTEGLEINWNYQTYVTWAYYNLFKFDSLLETIRVSVKDKTQKKFALNVMNFHIKEYKNTFNFCIKTMRVTFVYVKFDTMMITFEVWSCFVVSDVVKMKYDIWQILSNSFSNGSTSSFWSSHRCKIHLEKIELGMLTLCTKW